MAELIAAAEATISAPASTVVAILRDFGRHREILPPAFSNLVVEQGGVGAGTIVSFDVTLGGRTQRARSRVEEPAEGVIEEHLIGRPMVTTFRVRPDGGRSVTSIETTWRPTPGVAGIIERLLVPRMLKSLYREELANLDRVARAAHESDVAAVSVTGAAVSAPDSEVRPATTTRLDVLVIGAGQAGLATGRQLRTARVRFELVERNDAIGDSWRQRYDSLSLFTPRSYSHLPGLLLDGDQEGYPTRDEFADYLSRYQREFDIPVRLGTAVESLERQRGQFIATLSDGSTIESAAVVVASGAFQDPAVPELASKLSSAVTQLTPLTYHNPSSVPPGIVLVVGDGATGRQLAKELTATHTVLLATGKTRSFAPQRLLGRSLFWWLDHLGLLRASNAGRIGRRLQARDAVPRRDLADWHLAAAGVALLPRLVGVDDASATFAGGQSFTVGSVIWATGYRDQTTWVRIPDALDAAGRFAGASGVSPVPGLFFVGRPWQRTQGSGIVAGVAADARWIVQRATETLDAETLRSDREGCGQPVLAQG